MPLINNHKSKFYMDFVRGQREYIINSSTRSVCKMI
nr:MAG TPA: hypothetical protein [Caudoviricetes sp.]